MRGLNLERMAIAACGAGNAQKAIDIAQDYATQRIQFDRPISKFQVIAHKLADMRIKAEIARLVTYRTAEMLDAGYDTRMETAIAKIVATDNDFECAAYRHAGDGRRRLLDGARHAAAVPGLSASARSAAAATKSSATSSPS